MLDLLKHILSSDVKTACEETGIASSHLCRPVTFRAMKTDCLQFFFPGETWVNGTSLLLTWLYCKTCLVIFVKFLSEKIVVLVECVIMSFLTVRSATSYLALHRWKSRDVQNGKQHF